MPRFDPTGHPMLTGDANALAPAALAAHAELAELVLGIRDAPVGEADGKTAVALQVSYQVELDVTAYFATGEQRGRRSINYRSGRDGKLPPAHSLARELVERAIGPVGWGVSERRGVR